MAKDPAVSSIDCDCLLRVSMSLPESDSSSPGDHGIDQVEAVTRRLSVHVGAPSAPIPWGLDRIDTNGRLSTDDKYDDGDLTGKGVRVYIVDTGVQGSHVDFGGRVVNGHTVRAAPVAACTRPLPVPPAHQLNHAPQHPPHHPTTAHCTPSPRPSLTVAGICAPRVRFVPSSQRHSPRRRHWVQRARHPRGLDRWRPKVRRR